MTTNDLISRESALALVRDICDAIMSCCGSHYDEEVEDEVYDDIREVDAILKCNKEIRTALKNLPSKQPEQQWISCSERLPEDEYVLISKKPTKLSGSKWSVGIAIRMADPRSREIQWRDSGFGVIQDDKVLAWMPLPEPYQEGEHDG